ncbi:PREDICTED: glucosidase 2 subunit beta [Dufourea novaeangliae]|uniref:Glucosidase 2 subunit beta n=1 Tax=Dufourea novaeangliae TaxID=178035 RepID=A0A154PSW3_DUFNO|nr:PREDICTED: glucosidase 2 subunit beta [Dufourea novaeangliae]KZC14414.1 Glucosidase 2 subunit beta [Dufourea novaeangliae]
MTDHRVCLVLVLSVGLSTLLGHVAGSKVLQIRGIPTTKSSLYSPDRDFQCLDGSLLIPFTRVNDDYCDCADGSDEPGTPACTNGSFYCENFGYKARYIPSTWVNDGICDCCDASDEYGSSKECSNNCNELGKEARLEQQKAQELIREGNKIRSEMIAKGKQLKNDYRARLVKVRADYEEALLVKKEKELLKTQAEERETAALEKYKPTELEQPPAEEGEEEEELHESEVEDYFKLLDSDGSGTVTIMELKTRVTFDKDRDGVVTEEEAMYFLNNQKEVNLQEFIDSAWANIKPFLMLEEGMFKLSDRKDEGEEEETQEHIEEPLELEKEEDDGSEGEEAVADEQEKIEESAVQYDEETQAIIDEATSARENFQSAERSVNELLSEIRKLEEMLERDYGVDEEFASLDAECYEYTDLEYVYTLCMFAKVLQKSKSGGSDIILGHWNEWVEPEHQKYSKMKYDRGLTCWNGPARSTVVSLSCGKENRLLSVTEPMRCEYAMEFSTPALCNPSVEIADTHDEL